MHIGEQHSSRADPAGATGAAWPPHRLRRPAGAPDRSTRPAVRRWLTAAAWIGGSLALFALLLRISLSSAMTSDGANNALQAWDLLHGHFLLHGWIIGDATYYTFELPLYAIIEFFFGLHGYICHLAAALTYLIVAAFGMALARRGSSGQAAAARCVVVVAVLAAALVTELGVSMLLESPDHVGTTAILLGSFLLIDRAPDRRFTAPLLGAILCAGQLGDATVRYIAVPAILVVCTYRILAARKIRTPDTAIALAAAASVPLATLARAVMLHLGAYVMVSPRVAVAAPAQWAQHAGLAVRALGTLFGVAAGHPATPLSLVTAAFGLACLLAALAGFLRVLLSWGTASRAEQLLCVAIAVNLAVYVISTIPGPQNAREIAAVLPCGAVLAARACVPAHIVGAARARVTLATAALAALLPLATAVATRPPVTPAAVPLSAWLESHGLEYGLAGYWDASSVTLQSGNQVQVRAVTGRHFAAGRWETKVDWYYPSLHDATFVIAASPHAHAFGALSAAAVERYFGRPGAIDRVAGRVILIYRTNLLKRVRSARPVLNGGGL